MHALNAYFGCAKLDSAAFESEITNYDADQKKRGYIMSSAHAFDTTTGDHRNIIAYILAKYGVFARTYDRSSKSTYSGLLVDRPNGSPSAIEKAKSYGVAFIYSPDHIWLIRRDGDLWYKIDSLSGITQYNLAELSHSSLGLIIPTTRLIDEFNEIASELNALVMPDIIDYLIDAMKNKKVIGDAETLMGAACTLLELQNNGRAGYEKLDELFAWYGEFTQKFRDGNCASLKFILNTVPQIIARIIAIWRCSRRLLV